MAKFIQLTTRKIKNLSLGKAEERAFKIDLNVDHILLIRPNANDSSSCVIFVNGICSAVGDRDMIYVDYDRDDADRMDQKNAKREDERSAHSSMIIVEESYEQVREMLLN